MAKNARAIVEEPELIPDPVTEMITYSPGPMDPVHVTWCGHKFEANIGKEIKGHAAGTAREQLNAGLIEAARNNKLFRVGNAKAKRDPAKDPATAEEYRQYFVEWLKLPGFDHAEDLIARFSKDRDLQTLCGVGTDDYEFMGTLFMPKLHELAKRDELNDNQLGAVWLRYGYNQLPW
jgi:hypothetical protein